MTLRDLGHLQSPLMSKSCEASSEEEFLVLHNSNNPVTESTISMAFKVRSLSVRSVKAQGPIESMLTVSYGVIS